MEDRNEAEEELASPQPEVWDYDSRPTLRRIAVTAALAGGATLLVATCVLQPLPGATRSARLKWEQRQAEIENSIRGGCAQQEAGHDDGRKS